MAEAHALKIKLHRRVAERVSIEEIALPSWAILPVRVFKGTRIFPLAFPWKKARNLPVPPFKDPAPFRHSKEAGAKINLRILSSADA